LLYIVEGRGILYRAVENLALMLLTLCISMFLVPSLATYTNQVTASQFQEISELYLKECGPTSVCFVAGLFGKPIPSLDQAKIWTEWSPERGVTMLGLGKAVEENLGLFARGVEFSAKDALLETDGIAILHLQSCEKEGHYVVLAGVSRRTREVFVVDWPLSVGWKKFDNLSERWTGKALLISSQPFAAVGKSFPRRLALSLFGGIMLALIAWLQFGVRRKSDTSKCFSEDV